MGNFEMFDGPWLPYREIAEAAEKMVFTDPNASMSKLRSFGEMMAQELWQRYQFPVVESISQFERIRQLEENDMIDRQVTFYFHELRVKGNKAAHNAMYGTPDEAIALLSVAYQLSTWFVKKELDQVEKRIPPFKKPMLHQQQTEVVQPVTKPKEQPLPRSEKKTPDSLIEKRKKQEAAQKAKEAEIAKAARQLPKKTSLPKKQTPPMKQQAKAQETVTTVKRMPTKEPKRAAVHKQRTYSLKWVYVALFVLGIGTALLFKSDAGTSQTIFSATSKKEAPIVTQKIEAYAGDRTYSLDALYLIRGDAQSEEQISTYTTSKMTVRSGYIFAKDTYGIMNETEQSYQLQNGQFIQKEAVTEANMDVLTVYQEQASDEIIYGTVQVILKTPLNVRSGPTTTSPIVGITYEGFSYPVYEQKGTWYRIAPNVWITGNTEYVTYTKGSGAS